MSRTFSASEICARALRMIGAFPVTETAPDGEQLREAMSWLDMILGESAAMQEIGVLQPSAPVSLTLVAGTQTYILASVMGSAYPENGIQFVMDAWLEDEDGNRSEITIVSRQTFDAHSDPDETGTPTEIYVDQADSKTIRTFPTLPASETETYTIKMRVQTYAPDISFKGVTGTQPTSTTLHQFADAWQRFLVYRLAADLGAGPIAALPQPRVDHFSAQAGEAWLALDGFQNRERTTEPPIAEPWGY